MYSLNLIVGRDDIKDHLSIGVRREEDTKSFDEELEKVFPLASRGDDSIVMTPLY